MRRRLLVTAALLTVAACSGEPTSPAFPDDAAGTAHSVKFWEAGSSVYWNARAVTLFRARGGPAGRMLTYLALAQYRAVLAAERGVAGAILPSSAAAAAGASTVVLKQFFPLDADALEAELAAQRAGPQGSSEKQKDFAAGEAIGRAVGTAVLAQAAADNFGIQSPGAPPIGPGFWTSSGAPTVTGGLGARPFFLHSGDELRSPPPPAFGSADYLAALAEVRATSDGRTDEQLAIARKWVPFSGVVFNGIAGELIVKHHRTEREAARIFAYASAAAYDANIGCFDTKFTHWYIRPSKADAAITTPVGLPNHPSYPSAHSCETGAWEAVLVDAFPSERESIVASAREAGLSRLYGGIHYRFDMVAGETLGLAAGRLALQRGGLE